MKLSIICYSISFLAFLIPKLSGGLPDDNFSRMLNLSIIIIFGLIAIILDWKDYLVKKRDKQSID